MAGTRIMQTGTREYLEVAVTADVLLDTQPVEVSVDKQSTWLDAEWIGSAATTRTCRVLLGDTNPLPSRGKPTIYVRVTDNPEIVVIEAGTLEVR